MEDFEMTLTLHHQFAEKAEKAYTDRENNSRIQGCSEWMQT
jgi:hypothetical protein